MTMNCPICLDKLNGFIIGHSSEKLELQCLFHKKCLDNYVIQERHEYDDNYQLKESFNCPLCRESYDIDDYLNTYEIEAKKDPQRYARLIFDPRTLISSRVGFLNEPSSFYAGQEDSLSIQLSRNQEDSMVQPLRDDSDSDDDDTFRNIMSRSSFGRYQTEIDNFFRSMISSSDADRERFLRPENRVEQMGNWRRTTVMPYRGFVEHQEGFVQHDDVALNTINVGMMRRYMQRHMQDNENNSRAIIPGDMASSEPAQRSSILNALRRRIQFMYDDETDYDRCFLCPCSMCDKSSSVDEESENSLRNRIEEVD